MTATMTAPATMVWSAEQQAIFARIDAAVRSRKLDTGHTMVQAGPGSGKTTTMVEQAKRLSAAGVRGILVTAFGRGIVGELQQRLRGVAEVEVKSIYGVGYKVVRTWLQSRYSIRDVNLDENKYTTIVREYVQTAFQGWLEAGQVEGKESEAREWLLKLVNYTRLTLTDASSVKTLEAMALEYNLDYEPVLLAAVSTILDQGIAAARKGWIDFTDQIWLVSAVRNELGSLKVWRYSVVILDEAQDISNASRAVARFVLWDKGLFIGVGDRDQSIMGFSGADMRSFDNTTAAFGATVLPLMTCYRCDAAIIRVLQKTVPALKGRDNAPEGMVRSIKERQVFGELKLKLGQNVVVLCRTTAELVSLCIQLIRDGIPAQVKGRDIGAKIVGYLEKIAKLDGFNYPDSFVEYANAFRGMQSRKHQQPDGMGGWEVKPGHERRVQEINDYVDTLVICFESWAATTLDALKDKISSLFADDVKGILLMTGHRSKGLEFDTVYILRGDRMELSWPGMTDDQKFQERCVRFVMESRAKHELVYVLP